MEIPITFVGESCSLTLCDFAFVIRSKRRKSFSLAIVDDREDLIKDFCLTSARVYQFDALYQLGAFGNR